MRSTLSWRNRQISRDPTVCLRFPPLRAHTIGPPTWAPHNCPHHMCATQPLAPLSLAPTARETHHHANDTTATTTTTARPRGWLRHVAVLFRPPILHFQTLSANTRPDYQPPRSDRGNPGPTNGRLGTERSDKRQGRRRSLAPQGRQEKVQRTAW